MKASHFTDSLLHPIKDGISEIYFTFYLIVQYGSNKLEGSLAVLWFLPLKFIWTLLCFEQINFDLLNK